MKIFPKLAKIIDLRTIIALGLFLLGTHLSNETLIRASRDMMSPQITVNPPEVIVQSPEIKIPPSKVVVPPQPKVFVGDPKEEEFDRVENERRAGPFRRMAETIRIRRADKRGDYNYSGPWDPYSNPEEDP